MAKNETLYNSATEAGNKELAKLAKDMKYAQMLLTELNLAELPSHVFEDNAGAIFLSRN